MSSEPRGGLTGFRRVAADIGGPWALSPAMVLLTFPLTVLNVVWVGWINSGPSAGWFLVGFAAQAAMVLVGLLVRPWLLPRLQARPRAGLVLGFFALAGLARGLTTTWLIPALGLEPRQEVGWRLGGAVLIMLITGGVFSWGLGGQHRYRQQMAELHRIGAALSLTGDQLSGLLADAREQVLRRVEQAMATPLAELRALVATGAGAIGQATLRMEALIDETVKPLSRHLASEVRAWAPQVPPAHAADLAPRLAGVRVRRPLLPEVQALTVGALPIALLTSQVGLGAAIAASSGIAVAAWLVLAGLERLRARLIGARGFGVSLVLVALASTAAALPITVILSWYLGPDQGLQGHQWGSQLVLVVSGLALLGASVVQQLRAETEASVRASNAQLAVEVARVSTRLWLQRNRIAHILHGPVQGALIVAVARLAAVARDEAPMPPAEEVLGPVEVALAQLQEAAEPAPDLVAFLAQLGQVWSGVLTLDTHVAAGVAAALREDPATAAVVTTVVRELVSNAHRHGRADWAMVEVELAGADRLRLQVVDNGPENPAASSPGLGSSLLDATALHWARRISDTGATVTAEFPIRDGSASAAATEAGQPGPLSGGRMTP